MSIGPEAGRRHGRVTGWVGALRRRPWVAERSDDAAYRDDEAVAAARAESGACTAPARAYKIVR